MNDIQGQDSQEVDVEGCNNHIWWRIAQRNPFDSEKLLYNKLQFAGYLRDIKGKGGIMDCLARATGWWTFNLTSSTVALVEKVELVESY